MITWNEVWVILAALALVGFGFGILSSSRNWFKRPILAILINNAPLVIYIRVFGIKVCRIGEPDYLNDWNTFSFNFYCNFYTTIKWCIYGHQLNKVCLLKTEFKSMMRKIIYGKKKVIYVRKPGAMAFLVLTGPYGTKGDYFVAGNRTIKQRFKKTIHETGYLLIGECDMFAGKCFIETPDKESLRMKMIEVYENLNTLSNIAGKLNLMVAKATANVKRVAGEGRVIDA